MIRPEPSTHAEMHARYLESRERLGMGRPVETPRARLAPLLRSTSTEESVDGRDLRPAEIEALADALLRRMREEAADLAGLPRPMLVSDIIATVARRAGLSPADLHSRRRDVSVVRARGCAMWLARRITSHSLPVIGRGFGRDHTTVLSNVKKVEARRATDPALSDDLAEIEAELRERFRLPDLSGAADAGQ